MSLDHLHFDEFSDTYSDTDSDTSIYCDNWIDEFENEYMVGDAPDNNVASRTEYVPTNCDIPMRYIYYEEIAEPVGIYVFCGNKYICPCCDKGGIGLLFNKYKKLDNKSDRTRRYAKRLIMKSRELFFKYNLSEIREKFD